MATIERGEYLWPHTPPGGEGVILSMKVGSFSGSGVNDRFLQRIDRPQFWVRRPKQPDGSAVLVIAGGAYGLIVIDHEGFETAARLNDAGITAFVLGYRLPSEGWRDGADVPLQDAQRAMRLIRSRARHYGIDPKRLGVLGFSAGGHLAASLATRFADRTYSPVDAADKLDARPAFAGMVYPVITMGPGTHDDSRSNLLGYDQGAGRQVAYSCETRVTPQTPPCFLSVGNDDTLVPPWPNTVAMYKALKAAGNPAEMHIFANGPHGYGLTGANPVGERNARLFLGWGARGGWFKAS